MSTIQDTSGPSSILRLCEMLLARVWRSGFQISAFQLFKSVLAATMAWWVSTTLLNTPYPFLSPWMALMTIQTTVNRTVRKGLQSAIASTLGIAVSFCFRGFLGVSMLTYALAILVALVIARFRWSRSEGLAVATTVIFVLSDGLTEHAPQLAERMLEIVVGVLIALAINIFVFPPVRDQQAVRYLESVTQEMGVVLERVGMELSSSWDAYHADGWLRQVELVDSRASSARSVVRFARESNKANLLHRISCLKASHSAWDAVGPDGSGWEDVMDRVDEGLLHLRSLTRTLRDATHAEGHWDGRFREQWADILWDVGKAISDPEAEIAPLQDRLTRLTEDISHDQHLPRAAWPTYGALIAGLGDVIRVVGELDSFRRAWDTSRGSR